MELPQIDPKDGVKRLSETAQERAGKLGDLAAETAQKAVKGTSDIASEAVRRASEAMSVAKQKAALSIYRPVFPGEGETPKMIVIADEDDRKDIEVCQGSIGWSGKAGGLDVLHLYEEVVSDSDIVFFPQPQLYSVYYQDALDSHRYISLDCYFDTIQKDKFTELKRIAFDLGAKRCRLESYEETKSIRVVKTGAGAKKKNGAEKTTVTTDTDATATSQATKSIVFSQTFDGNDEPRRPELHWFANNKEIEFLIDTRCNSENAGKTKEYSMQLSSMAMQTMNVQTAIKIDKALAKLGTSCNFSLEGEAKTEQRRTLVFEIEF